MRLMDQIRLNDAAAELKGGPLTRERVTALRQMLLARAAQYGGGGERAQGAAKPTGDALEDELFRLAVERAAPLAVAIDAVLTGLLSEMAG